MTGCKDKRGSVDTLQDHMVEQCALYQLSPEATNLINPQTCKSSPVLQQCAIKSFNYTPLYIEGIEHVQVSEPARLRVGCW